MWSNQKKPLLSVHFFLDLLWNGGLSHLQIQFLVYLVGYPRLLFHASWEGWCIGAIQLPFPSILAFMGPTTLHPHEHFSRVYPWLVMTSMSFKSKSIKDMISNACNGYKVEVTNTNSLPCTKNMILMRRINVSVSRCPISSWRCVWLKERAIDLRTFSIGWSIILKLNLVYNILPLYARWIRLDIQIYYILYIFYSWIIKYSLRRIK